MEEDPEPRLVSKAAASAPGSKPRVGKTSVILFENLF